MKSHDALRLLVTLCQNDSNMFSVCLFCLTRFRILSVLLNLGTKESHDMVMEAQMLSPRAAKLIKLVNPTHGQKKTRSFKRVDIGYLNVD